MDFTLLIILLLVIVVALSLLSFVLIRQNSKKTSDINQETLELKLQNMVSDATASQLERIVTVMNSQKTETDNHLKSELKTITDTLSKNNQETSNSFSNFSKNINEQLERLSKNAGEMALIAGDVRSLNKTLSNVKTRGNLGEIRLEALLSDTMSPNQYESQACVKENTGERVDFVVKLPGNAGEEVLLPIDSKWPSEDYERLVDAENAEELSKDLIDKCRKSVFSRVETFAKDISKKYINTPLTTDFAIMYLPTDGLYFEIVRNSEFIEKLRKQMHVVVTGPTTLFAILDALQIGFKTLAVEQKSKEVWDVLQATSQQFVKFGEELDKCIKQISTVSTTLNSLKTTRTNQILRQLEKVEKYDNI